MADAFAACGALQCGFCTPGIVVRTKALIDKNGTDLTREQASRHLGAHLCRCTGYIKVLDAVEALAQDNVPVVVQPGGVGSRGVKYEGRELSIGTRDFIDDMRPAGMLHGALRLTDHARADIVAHRRVGCTRRRRRPCRVHRGRHSGGSTRRHHPQGLAGDDPRRWSHVVPRRCARHRRCRHPPDRPRRRRTRHRRVRRARADGRPGPRGRQRRPGRVGTRRQHPVDLHLLTRRRRRRARRGSAHRLGDVPDPAHRARLPRTRVDPRRALRSSRRPHPVRVLRRSGHLGRPQRHRRDARRRHRTHHHRTRLERWCVRRQGGHVEPGAHRARRLAHRRPGEDHAVARRVAADAPEAPPDPDALRSRVRRRRQAHRDQGPHDRRLGSVCLGRHEGARACRRPCHRAVSRRQRRRRGGCRAHQQLGVRCVPRASVPTRRSSPWKA